MTNQPLTRDPHRYQPDDQFTQNPGGAASSLPEHSPEPLAQPPDQPSVQPPAQPSAPQPSQPTSTAASQVSPQAIANLPRPEPEQMLIEWDAPSRPHKKRHRQYYTTIAVILILIGLILFFAGQFLPIAVLAAIGFLVYVLEMVPPTIVHHAITTYGFRVEGTLYYWDEIGRFWFTERHGMPLLHLEIGRFPNRLTLLIGDLPQDALTELLSEVLIHEQPALTPLEKAGAWLERTLPLEPPQPNV